MKNLLVSACRWFCVALLCMGLARAQEVTLTARIELVTGTKSAKAPEAENVVVWLVPEGGTVGPAAFDQRRGAQSHIAPAQLPRLVQHNKTFEPHVLVVP
ncbi:MAG: hypothetical protein ACRD3W_22150, partial [Terriglobales bacterium]